MNRPPAGDDDSPVAIDSAMDQALDWLIKLPCASPAERRAFDAWLAADPAHTQAFMQAEAVWQGAPVRQAAASLAQQRRPSRLQRLRPHWKPLATAAALVVGLLSFSSLPLRLQADHLTVVGERQRLQLEDGSKVLLNTNSAFSSKVDATQRRARLYHGEAYFEVSANPSQPLEVEAGPVKANARDSDFAVRYLDGEAQVKVQRGNLDLLASHQASVRLSAGDSIRIGPAGFGQRERIDPSADLAWVQGRLIFENCPLSQVLAELRRYYPGWIVSNNEKLDRVAVTGNYRLDDPLSVVRSLAHITSASLHEYPALVILN